MKGRIIFATGNENKLREIREILGDLSRDIISMKEAGFEDDIIEDGNSFEENALIKVRTIGEAFPDDIIIADDSGLCIDAWNGEPGIYSARYLGEDTPYTEKNNTILSKMKDVPEKERGAQFVCAAAAHLPDGSDFTVRGVIEGRIGYEIAGEGGFGYDPIFYVEKYKCTTAEMSPEQKNEISHRGKAMRLMREELVKRLGDV
ncbi:MAG: RdgB/HAM1 family non-canonical purine NTP pyrophosphatase [Lachnospiraceae bacterium]|nr:RdgB/HAM1 family non-canonical purine NTP pyrophosphatase [Lachnospiraceae bacterium]